MGMSNDGELLMSSYQPEDFESWFLYYGLINYRRLLYHPVKMSSGQVMNKYLRSSFQERAKTRPENSSVREQMPSYDLKGLLMPWTTHRKGAITPH